ncbi:CHC2 zinc finger domain-containing protein [Bacillus paranthracis]|uniref:CHC2 zinc finger domain-containing protein n=1 Tax=Bacillus paranthracis TaxID=2026186 RepID=UPI0021582D45|nr:CHC2 zinc finger domain-containing protein [Bacillus paranthracis]MCR6795763.1 CHC2 zinc finger domain-containing protein [Bacillus paranthracis]MED1169318.1 CHC2 zinc finger domain-containing protein [Bacillus paranthracis]
MQKSDLIKSKLPIINFLKSYCGVTVRKRGKNYMCKCPFHADDKDSMVVNVSDNNCFCFAGCGNRRPIDQFSGLMLLHGWTHKQAETFLLKELKLDVNLNHKNMQKEIAKQKAIHKKMQQMKDLENALLQALLNREKEFKQLLRLFDFTTEAEMFHKIYHKLPILEYEIDILLSDDTQAKYEVMKYYLGGLKQYEKQFKSK